MEDPGIVRPTICHRHRDQITSETSNLGREGDRDTYGDTLNFEDAVSSQYSQNPAPFVFKCSVGTGVSDVHKGQRTSKIEPRIDTDQVTGRARSGVRPTIAAFQPSSSASRHPCSHPFIASMKTYRKLWSLAYMIIYTT